MQSQDVRLVTETALAHSQKFNSRLSTYNFKASNTRWLRESLERAQLGTSASHWTIIGDSLSSGFIGGGSAAGYDLLNAWPLTMRNLLSSDLGVPIGGTGIVPAGQWPKDSPDLLLSLGSRWSFAGTWVNNGGYLAGNANGAAATFTSDVPGTQVDIFPFRSSGAFTYSIDGAAPVTWGPGDGAVTPGRITVSGLANTRHTIVITRADAATPTYLAGVMVSNPSTGLHVHNLGVYGETINTFATASDTTLAALNRMLMLDLLYATLTKVVFFKIGLNDITEGRTAAQIEADYTTVRTSARFASADAVIVVEHYKADLTQAQMDSYTGAMYSLADQFDCPLIDLYDRQGTTTQLVNDGMVIGDQTHYTTKGHKVAGRQVSAAVLDAVDAQVPLLTKICYNASDYGARGDGIADDTAALNNAAAAAAAAGGGLVCLDKRNAVYKITGQVTLGDFVGLVGYGSVGLNAPTNPLSVIRLASATACVVFGNQILDSTHAGQTMYSPGGGWFDIDANSTGPAEGAFRVDGVNQINLYNVGVVNAGRTGWRVASGQNSTFENVAVHNSGLAGTGDGLHITGGAGGNKFTRCYTNGTSTDGYHLNLDKTAGIYDVYSNGPSHNRFDHCIFETTASTGGIVRLNAGGLNVFDSCLFSGPDTNSDPTKILASGTAVLVDGSSVWAHFRSCNYVVVGGAMHITANAAIRVDGFSVFQTTQALFHIDNASPNFDFEQGPAVFVIAQPLYSLTGTGSLVNAKRYLTSEQRLMVSADADPNINQMTAFSVFKYGETQARFFIDRNGGLAWGPGGSTFPPNLLQRDATLGVLSLTGGLKVSGRYITGGPGWVFGGGTNTYNIDSSTSKWFRYAFQGGGSPTFNLTNPVDGAEVSIVIQVTATALTGSAWTGSAFYWRNGSAPLLNPNTYTVVHLRYDATIPMWIETGRDVSVIGAAQPEQLPTGVNISNGLTRSGKWVENAPGWVYAGGTATYTLDASTSKWFRYMWTSGGTPTLAFSNPVDGSEITLMLWVGPTALTSMTWPTSANWKNGAAPLLAPNTVTTLTLRYESGVPGWFEVSRLVASTNNTPLVEQIPNGLNVSNGLTVAGSSNRDQRAISIPATVPPTASSGPMTMAYNAASFFNANTYVTSGALGNWFEYDVAVDAGTYTLRTLYQKQNLAGILRVLVDGTQVASVDAYSSAAVLNNVLDTTGIALTGGRHTIRFISDTKNASSTGYFVLLYGFALSRSGA